MMNSALKELEAVAVAYCDAVHYAKSDVFEDMCDAAFTMVEVGDGALQNRWDKSGYVDRVANRAPFPGAPSYEILGMDMSGQEMARVHLWVDVPPRRYEDHLGFVRIGASWKLMTKVFRTAAHMDEE